MNTIFYEVSTLTMNINFVLGLLISLLVSVTALPQVGQNINGHAKESSLETLSSLFVIHRHADRTPVISYPKDPYACHWKQGYGVLIDNGLKRMREYGRILREKYGNFWPEKSDIKIHSSNVDRVIKSVESLLDGVYKDRFHMNPIPIVANPIPASDKMLFPITTDCPKYLQELDRVFNLPENVEWFNSKKLWSYLNEHSGVQFTKLDSNYRLQIVDFHDVFLVQKQFNLTLPEWMTDEIYAELTAAAAYQMRLIYSTPLAQRLAAGLLFKELRRHMESIELGEHFKKVRIYSTHDAKVAALLSGLNVYNGISPPYGASVIFEFHSKVRALGETDNFIKGYYLNDTSTAVFHPLEMEGCDIQNGCTFDHFHKLIGNLIPINWHEECKL